MLCRDRQRKILSKIQKLTLVGYGSVKFHTSCGHHPSWDVTRCGVPVENWAVVKIQLMVQIELEPRWCCRAIAQRRIAVIWISRETREGSSTRTVNYSRCFGWKPDRLRNPLGTGACRETTMEREALLIYCTCCNWKPGFWVACMLKQGDLNILPSRFNTGKCVVDSWNHNKCKENRACCDSVVIGNYGLAFLEWARVQEKTCKRWTQHVRHTWSL